jgi:hypothetical protein
MLKAGREKTIKANITSGITSNEISCIIKFKAQYLSTPWHVNIRYFLL